MKLESNLKHYIIVAGTALLIIPAFFIGSITAGSDNTQICTSTNSEMHQSLDTVRKLDGKDSSEELADISQLNLIIERMNQRRSNSSVRDSILKENQLQLEKVNKNLKGLQ